tara:strand:+ start:10083 stop:10544 length:462 start_codon:yes stop_codon:yes gene_type:complete
MANYLDLSTKSVEQGEGRLPKLRGQICPVVTVTTAATTLYDHQSGATVFLTISGGSNVVITLPEVAAGLNFTFVATASPSGAGDAVITSATADTIAICLGPDAAADGTFASASDTVTLEAAALGGEVIRFVSDGTKWYAFANQPTVGSVTTAG